MVLLYYSYCTAVVLICTDVLTVNVKLKTACTPAVRRVPGMLIAKAPFQKTWPSTHRRTCPLMTAKICGLLPCRVVPVAVALPPTQGTHLPEASSTFMPGQKELLLLLYRCDMAILLAGVDRGWRPMSPCTRCRKKEGIAFSQDKR